MATLPIQHLNSIYFIVTVHYGGNNFTRSTVSDIYEEEYVWSSGTSSIDVSYAALSMLNFMALFSLVMGTIPITTHHIEYSFQIIHLASIEAFLWFFFFWFFTKYEDKYFIMLPAHF